MANRVEKWKESALVFWLTNLGTQDHMSIWKEGIPQRHFKPDRLYVISRHEGLYLRNVQIGINACLPRDTRIDLREFEGGLSVFPEGKRSEVMLDLMQVGSRMSGFTDEVPQLYGGRMVDLPTVMAGQVIGLWLESLPHQSHFLAILTGHCVSNISVGEKEGG